MRAVGRDMSGEERPREYLATGASAKYASRIRGGSTLFARQLYFLFANKCVPLKIIFNVHVMWSPRDGCARKVYFDSVVPAQCFSSLRATWTRVELCIPREEKMIKNLTDYLCFVPSSNFGIRR